MLEEAFERLSRIQVAATALDRDSAEIKKQLVALGEGLIDRASLEQAVKTSM